MYALGTRFACLSLITSCNALKISRSIFQGINTSYILEDTAHISTCMYLFQPEKTEVVRTKRKYEKKPKITPLSAPLHTGPSLFNPKDLNQYDFPSSDDEPFSQVHMQGMCLTGYNHCLKAKFLIT